MQYKVTQYLLDFQILSSILCLLICDWANVGFICNFFLYFVVS